ncbi:MAG: MipA/OmpV family protein [Gammaproteobacteria bacterium]|nr:MipA/OmpV family protein [Gammaproteobacteria bacterium]
MKDKQAHMLILEVIRMKKIFTIILFCLVIKGVVAKEAEEAEIELGLATIYSDNGIESSNEFYPYISYSNDNFYFEGTSFGFSMTEGTWKDKFDYETSAFISYELNGFEQSEELASLGLEEPNHSIDLGGQIDIVSPFGGISLSVQRDISNTYDGNQATFSLGVSLEGESWSFVPFVSFDYYSKEFVDYYYYGNQGTLQLPPENQSYKAEATVNKSIGYLVDYELSKRWSIAHSLQYGLNGSSIKSSPLSDGNKFTEVQFVISYIF